MLELLEALPGARGRIDRAAQRADAALDLALRARLARQARIDVKAHGESVAAVAFVECAPGAGTAHDGGLAVVHTHNGGNTAECLEGPVVAPEPTGEVLRVRPADRSHPRVREDHRERGELDRATADDDAGEVAPVDLGLGPGRSLHATPGAASRLGVVLGDEALYRAQASAVVVLGDEPGMELGGVGSGHRVVPVGDGVGDLGGESPLPGAAVGRAGLDALQVVANGSFGEVELTGDLTVGNAASGEGLDGHLQLRVGHGRRRSIRKTPA